MTAIFWWERKKIYFHGTIKCAISLTGNGEFRESFFTPDITNSLKPRTRLMKLSAHPSPRTDFFLPDILLVHPEKPKSSLIHTQPRDLVGFYGSLSLCSPHPHPFPPPWLDLKSLSQRILKSKEAKPTLCLIFICMNDFLLKCNHSVSHQV